MPKEHDFLNFVAFWTTLIRPKAVSVKDILVRKEGERTGCGFYYSIFWYSIYYVVIWETVSQNRKISLSQCIVKKNILF